MKQILLIALVCLVGCSAVAFGQMDQTVLVSTQVATNHGYAVGLVKGEIFGIRLEATENTTNKVTLTTYEGEKILDVAALKADATYYPLVQAHSAVDGSVLNTIVSASTNAVTVRQGVSSMVTMKVEPDVGATGTNTVTAIITFKK